MVRPAGHFWAADSAPQHRPRRSLRIPKGRSETRYKPTGLNHGSRAPSVGLRRLRDLTGETAYLVVQEDNHVLSLDRFESMQSARSNAKLGALKPMHCTGQGKAILPSSRGSARGCHRLWMSGRVLDGTRICGLGAVGLRQVDFKRDDRLCRTAVGQFLTIRADDLTASLERAAPSVCSCNECSRRRSHGRNAGPAFKKPVALPPA